MTSLEAMESKKVGLGNTDDGTRSTFAIDDDHHSLSNSVCSKIPDLRDLACKFSTLKIVI